MKQTRFDALADGIFAIVMTLLVFEIHVPEIVGTITNQSLLIALTKLTPLFLSYLLSFSLLFTYWRAHHFIASVYAKNIDIALTNINAVFLFFVALVPFSSRLLGTYDSTQTAVVVFSANVIAIGLSLFWMRTYATESETIRTEDVSYTENLHAYARILFPVLCAITAIILSCFDTHFALFVLTVGILFNLSKNSTRILFDFLGVRQAK